MFKLLRRNAKQGPASDRGVFTFWDGERERTVDPMRIWRLIWTDTEVDFKDLVEQVETIDEEASPKLWFAANEELINFIRRVFDIKPVEEGGLTEIECKNVAEAFLEYMSTIKKKLDTSPTSSARTDSRRDKLSTPNS